MATPLTRATIIRGPAQISYETNLGTFKLYSQGDIKINIGYQTFPIINSSYGMTQERIMQRTATVEFTPVGALTTSSINYWDFGTKLSGDRMLGDTDNNLIVHSYAGTKATIYNVAITKIPELILSTTKTIAGAVTFTGLGKGMPVLAPQTETDSFYKIEEGQGRPTDDFDPNDVVTETYAAHVGSLASPWDDLHTANGWQCAFDLGLQPVNVDSHGIIDWTVGDVKATARGQILGITEAQAKEALLTIDIGRGSPIVYNALTIEGTHITVELPFCAVKVLPTQYGLVTLRLADVEFTGVRTVAAGSVQPVFTVTVS